MAYVDKTFSFDASLESWTAYPAGTTSMTRSTSDGSPGTGCLSARLTGKNNNPGTSYWEWVGTFEDLGVPSGQIITEIGTEPYNDFSWRCSEWDTGSSGNNYAGPMEIYDNTPTLIGTLNAASAGINGITAWTNKNGAAVTISDLPSNTTIRLRLNVTVRTANSSTAAVTILQDTILLRITYEPAPTTAPPTTVAPTTVPTTLPPTTLAPTTIPTTLAPTTVPTTLPPTTLAPTTIPTTLAPTTVPTTLPPTTLAPTTLPTTLPPTTLAPTTAPPDAEVEDVIIDAATTVAPTTLATTAPPTTLAPTTLPPTYSGRGVGRGIIRGVYR